MSRTGDSTTAAVVKAIGNRRLVYVGIRGGDAGPFATLPQLSHVIALTDDYEGREDVVARTVERLTWRRIDLDGEVELGERARAAFAGALTAATDGPSVLVAYRPNAETTQATLRAGGACAYLGLFDRQQSALEHKPFVDREVSLLGLPTLGWRVVRASDVDVVGAMLADGPVVARLAASSGGAGIRPVASLDEFADFMFTTGASTVSVSRYLADSLPLNVSGVVWEDGITLHPLSVQLIGVPGLSARPFGFCGNDFGAASSLETELVNLVESRTRTIGQWLRGQAYLGAFGVDFLAVGDDIVFCEINPRFQGSSRLSDRISEHLGLPGLAVEHTAAFLQVPAPTAAMALAEMTRAAPPWGQAIFHHQGEEAALDLTSAVRIAEKSATVLATEVVCPPDIVCAPGAVALRVVTEGALTVDGSTIHPAAGVVGEIAAACSGAAVSDPG